MAKPVWKNEIERDAFVETLCRRCFQPDEAAKRVMGIGDGCPLLAKADSGKMPREWTRRRNAVIGETFRCSDRLDKPPVNRRGTAPAETEPMFDEPASAVDFVPVEGWPSASDFGRKSKNTEGEHQ